MDPECSLCGVEECQLSLGKAVAESSQTEVLGATRANAVSCLYRSWTACGMDDILFAEKHDTKFKWRANCVYGQNV